MAPSMGGSPVGAPVGGMPQQHVEGYPLGTTDWYTHDPHSLDIAEQKGAASGTFGGSRIVRSDMYLTWPDPSQPLRRMQWQTPLGPETHTYRVIGERPLQPGTAPTSRPPPSYPPR
eukprot:402986_1